MVGAELLFDPLFVLEVFVRQAETTGVVGILSPTGAMICATLGTGQRAARNFFAANGAYLRRNLSRHQLPFACRRLGQVPQQEIPGLTPPGKLQQSGDMLRSRN